MEIFCIVSLPECNKNPSTGHDGVVLAHPNFCSKVCFSVFFRARFESSPLCLLHPIRIIDLFWKKKHFISLLKLLCTTQNTSKRQVLLKFFWCNILSSGCSVMIGFRSKKFLGELSNKRTHAQGPRPNTPFFLWWASFWIRHMSKILSNFIKSLKSWRGPHTNDWRMDKSCTPEEPFCSDPTTLVDSCHEHPSLSNGKLSFRFRGV